jgi:4-hydroxybenzoate polyprenyltransferase
MRSYFELLRPANVVTSLADGLTGFAIAGLANPHALPWLLLSTACLYAGGIALNDFFDREIDAAERPERPIPSARVPAAAASALGVVLLAGGIASSVLISTTAVVVATLLATLIVIYNTTAKHYSFLGPINMGACRGLNLLLGIAIAPEMISARWPLALLSFTYIVSVTALSRGEVSGGKRPVAVFCLTALLAVLCGLLTLSLISESGVSLWGLLLTTVLAWRVIPPFYRALIDSQSVVIRTAVRTGVLSLVILDATLAGIYAGPLFGSVVLSLALAAMGLARLFAVT